jgi:hypothetical protein
MPSRAGYQALSQQQAQPDDHDDHDDHDDLDRLAAHDQITPPHSEEPS